MSKKRLAIIFTMVFLIFSTICALLFIQNRKLSYISCNAFYAAKNTEAKLVSKNHMELNGEVGSWMMDGRMKVNDDTYYFKLRALFSVNRKGYVYYFTNKNVMLNPVELSSNKTLQLFLADILRIEKSQSFFTIKPVKNNYLIFSGDIPIMYCMSAK